MNNGLIKKYVSAFLATIAAGLIGTISTGSFLLLFPKYRQTYYGTDQALLGHFYLAVFAGLVYSILWLLFFAVVKALVAWKAFWTALTTSFLLYFFFFAGWGIFLPNSSGLWFLITVFMIGYALPLLHHYISKHLIRQH